MTQPTQFGANGNTAMVGGEAGPEAILPLNNKYLSVIGNAIEGARSKTIESNTNQVFNVTFNNTISSDYDTDSMFEKADRWFSDHGASKKFGTKGMA